MCLWCIINDVRKASDTNILFFPNTCTAVFARGRTKNGQQTHAGFLKKKNAVYVIFILGLHVLITLTVIEGTTRKIIIIMIIKIKTGVKYNLIL